EALQGVGPVGDPDRVPRVQVPVNAGVRRTEHGLVNVPPVSTNWTLVMVAPDCCAVAEASSVDAVPLTVALFDGEMTAVVGGLLLTVNVKAWVAVLEWPSVAVMVTG